MICELVQLACYTSCDAKNTALHRWASPSPPCSAQCRQRSRYDKLTNLKPISFEIGGACHNLNWNEIHASPNASGIGPIKTIEFVLRSSVPTDPFESLYPPGRTLPILITPADQDSSLGRTSSTSPQDHCASPSLHGGTSRATSPSAASWPTGPRRSPPRRAGRVSAAHACAHPSRPGTS